MTDSTNATSTDGPDGTPRPVRPALTRSRDDRVVAGVCGGVGRSLGVDPVLFRILLPVLAVFGGSGLVLYALGWLIIPEEGAPESRAQRLLHGHGGALTVLAVVAIVLGVFAFAVGDPGPPGGLLLAAIVLALVLYAWHAPAARGPAPAAVLPTGNDLVGWATPARTTSPTRCRRRPLRSRGPGRRSGSRP